MLVMRLEKYGICYVIYIVGFYCGGIWDEDKKEKLRKVIFGVLRKVEEFGVKMIVFLVVSVGIYGCLFEEVVKIFKEVIDEFEREVGSVERVYFVLYLEKDYERVLRVV